MQTAPASDRTLARNERGSSLVELLIGAVIVIAALIPVVTICLNMAKLRRLDMEAGLAFLACSNNLEEVRALAFSEIAAVDGRSFDVPGPNGQPGGLLARSGDADGLPGVMTVAIEEQSGTVILYRVTATVLWRGAAGDQTLQLDTLIANKE